MFLIEKKIWNNFKNFWLWKSDLGPFWRPVWTSANSSQKKILGLILEQKSTRLKNLVLKTPRIEVMLTYLLTCCWKFLSTKLKEAIEVHCWPKWPEWPPWWPNEMASVSMGKWWRDICNEIQSYTEHVSTVAKYYKDGKMMVRYL